jgi:predicted ribosome quality control (RQC) complex YloA/Tae2 family protein
MRRTPLNFLDLRKFVDELSFLDGGVVRNIKSRKNEFYLLIFAHKEYWLEIIPGEAILLHNEKPEDTVDFPFTLFVKKQLSGRRIQIQMHGSDRIVEFSFDGTKLIAELFSNGNIVLTEDSNILMSLFTRKYGSRRVASGEKYSYPAPGPDIFALSPSSFKNLLLNSKRENVVKALAVDLLLGGNYAEEVCFRAKVEKTAKMSELNAEMSDELYKRLTEIIREKRPNVINQYGFFSCEMTHIGGDKKYFDSIATALNSLYSQETQKIETKSDKKVALLGELVKRYEIVSKFLNDKYLDIENVIRISKDSNLPLDERLVTLKQLGWTLQGKKLVFATGNDIELDITKDLNQNIAEYYTKIKRVKREIKSKSGAAHKTLRRLEKKQTDAWYSKYRWFFTTSGRLVVAGRDTYQNEALIKKHAENGDLIAHADVFGSPFCLVKGTETLDDEMKNEVATFAASYSSAWKAGESNTDVYFVLPKQVTSTPPSGESLKKGAFFIEGNRDYVKNAPLAIFINFSFSDNGYDAYSTPYRAGEKYILIRPGRRDRNTVIKDITKKIAERYFIQIDATEIDKLLPPGKCRIEKIRL